MSNACLEWPGIEPGTVRVESSALDHSAILIDMENDENCSRYSSKTDIFLHSTTSHTLRYHGFHGFPQSFQGLFWYIWDVTFLYNDRFQEVLVLGKHNIIPAIILS